jgi:hypothetical protein
MAAYEIIRAGVERNAPNLLRRLYPRLYHNAERWESPLAPAVNLAGTLAAFIDPLLDSVPEARDLITCQVAATAAKLIEYDVPTYFVERDLALAVMQTDPPADGQWTEMHLPFPAGLLILPRDLGAGYKIPIRRTGAQGTHASPRLHWRRGRFRPQRIGEGRAEVKTIWIEPTLVGMED